MEDRVVKTSIGSLLQMGLLSFSSLIVTIVLSRLLSVEEFGVFSLVNALVFFLIIVFSCGVPASMARFIALAEDKTYRRIIVKNGLKVLFPWLIICSGLYFLCYRYILANVFNEYYFSGLGVIVLCLAIIEVARQLIEKLSHGVSRMSIAAELSAYSSFLLVAMLVVAAWFYGSAEAVLVAKIFALLLPIPLVLKKLADVFNKSVDEDNSEIVSSREIVRYGIPLSIVSLAAYCFLQADLLFLGRYWDVATVGLYSICAFVYLRLTIVPRAIGNGLAPHLARIGFSQAGVAKLEQGMSYALAFSIPVALFCATESELILTLVFGEKYSPAAPVFKLLALYFMIAALLAVLNPILDFSGKASVRAIGVVLGGLVNIGLDILWIPVYHMQGAAWATLIGYFVFFLIVVVNLEAGVVISLIRSHKIQRIVLVCFLMALIIVVTKYFFLAWSGLIIFLAFALVYPVLLLLFNAYSFNEVKSLVAGLTK